MFKAIVTIKTPNDGIKKLEFTASSIYELALDLEDGVVETEIVEIHITREA